ncbi:deoxyribodipyrimidine photolyase-related protein [Paraburkholderia bannensis]|uniref:Deoxyribodipyrimidine photolyase-related protein n=2 Tax=Burkholderiaceae TaxID=119060 RepID=A0A7W9TXN4_9BURK|nr:deoxyribodipyrimidine photolyase-related protein [Paraburkholderia sp. WP4_3_2]MBB6103306.1 deoxyribodipyrimidine photolyase-related protein [Paraburkholderia bannensis]
MCSLRPVDDMAAGVGEELGRRALLFERMPAPPATGANMTRRLVLVLGDQLDPDASAFDDFDPARDAVWMAEVAEESTHVWSSKPRIACFLAAMRHFAVTLARAGHTVHYTRLDDRSNRGTLAAELLAAIDRLAPESLVMTAPGDYRVLAALRETAAARGLALDVREDRHFFCTVREFAAHARGRKQLRLEFFYRELRKRHAILMDGEEPCGGRWNFDDENRNAFARTGPAGLPELPRFEPDTLTREVLALVEQRFAGHPGQLATFAWPVTREQALQALERFVAQRLPSFGRWQDALWPGEPWLWHSQLSAALNLKLLTPREVVDAAQTAWIEGRAPLESVEGFIRQILGWREYVRGIYWTQMPRYIESNALDAQLPLPDFYWSGHTPMACLADAIGQTLKHGYAHHIQRLMVTGLYALLLGVNPRAVHAWYLAVYVDAVEWVELPNTLGMSQAADGGLMASKPYIASGRYIERMSAGSLCGRCRFRPAERTGEHACPFTTLYWDFLMRHEALLAANPRMTMQVRNLARVGADERMRIMARAASIRAGALTQ